MHKTPRQPPSRPAPWVWYPERRTLANTFVFFRRELILEAAPLAARGWIGAESRYQLFVNGARVQRGPAPCDPRHLELDPLELSAYLRPGPNVIGVLVCSFGRGEGTAVPGKPGLLLDLELEVGNEPVRLVADESWQAHRARCWRPGSPRRWFLRALQEDFDARLYPHGWLEPGFDGPGSSSPGWRPAELLPVPPGKPPVCGDGPAYHEIGADPEACELVRRDIPFMDEAVIYPVGLTDAGWLDWQVPPDEFWECFTPGGVLERRDPAACQPLPGVPGGFVLAAPGGEGERSSLLTVAYEHELAGYPFVRVRAPAGTELQLLWAEANRPGALLLCPQPGWSPRARVVCREGVTEFEGFDFEAVKLLQLQARGAAGPVEVLELGVRRRVYPFGRAGEFDSPDPVLNELRAAGDRTLELVAQETTMDNAVRERQQYEGDGGHTKAALYYAFGETRLPRRSLRTFAHGQGPEGWFLDCYPAWDRLERLWQRHLGLSTWGPLLDHGLGFTLHLARHHLFADDLGLLESLWPAVQAQDCYLAARAGRGGLLPVSGYGLPSVWIDHSGYHTQADKEAAFNLYYAGYLREGVARIAGWLGLDDEASAAGARADRTLEAVRARYWEAGRALFVDNLPRLEADGEARLHDRTLSMALLYAPLEPGEAASIARTLAQRPAGLGRSYPCNAPWRLWALSRAGRIEAVLDELRGPWAAMPSLRENGVFGESWDNLPGSWDAWGQCSVAPTLALYGEVLGVTPTAPGFAAADIRPQLGNLPWVRGAVPTPRGPIRLTAERGNRRTGLRLTVPPGTRASIVTEPGVVALGPVDEPTGGPWPGTRRWPVTAAEASYSLETAGGAAVEETGLARG